MQDWLFFAVIAVVLFIAASFLATYAYGRFARRAQGTPSHALKRGDKQTFLDQKADELVDGHDGHNGLIMLSSNLDAFASRALSARAAERSLDLMYYIWKNDLTGRLLMHEAVAAADRGVRVRLLLDDVGVHGFDAAFLALASHRNIELRLFNPTRVREGFLRRGLEMALRLFSVTRRMHNKAWIVDGRIAVVGGRNVGDEYFDATDASNFRDLDLLVIGPVVDDVETMFDAYWNSGLALPIKAIAGIRPYSLKRLRKRLQKLEKRPSSRPFIERLRERVTLTSLFDAEKIHWCTEVRLVADPPEKAMGGHGENWLMRQLEPIFLSAQERLEITSPYFIPGDKGTDELVALAQRGVAVSVLTNSLAATDVAAVHGGYAPYRKPLLRGGIELYELQSQIPATKFTLRGSSNASLHTKAFTVDESHGFIGSLNFDPRSSSLNTEMGILFVSPTLMADMRALFAEEIAPDVSYRVELDGNGSLLWTAEDDGHVVRYDREPEASLFRRLTATVVGWLPLESQL